MQVSGEMSRIATSKPFDWDRIQARSLAALEAFTTMSQRSGSL
jgi:hypothetical protein